jgi:hypothetical protein
LLWLVWDTIWKQIRVINIIWKDKTDWLEYTALIYNGLDPYQNNISEPKIKSFSTVSNIIIWIDWNTSTTQIDNTSIWIFWALWETKYFRDWDLSNQTIQYLNSKKEEQKIFEVEIEKDLNLNVWDKCKLIIEETNRYLNFEWDVYINTQEIEYINRTKKVKTWISNIYVYIDNIVNRLRQNDKNIKLLQIK